MIPLLALLIAYLSAASAVVLCPYTTPRTWNVVLAYPQGLAMGQRILNSMNMLIA
jgi:hypothetical protein